MKGEPPSSGGLLKKQTPRCVVVGSEGDTQLGYETPYQPYQRHHLRHVDMFTRARRTAVQRRATLNEASQSLAVWMGKGDNKRDSPVWEDFEICQTGVRHCEELL